MPGLGTWADSHTKSSVNPYIEYDLRSAKAISVNLWAIGVFGLPPGRLEKWEGRIRDEQWFGDKIIAQCLSDYCAAPGEAKRYQPFVDLANRIVELARGKLPGLNDRYPVDDFTLAGNHENVVQSIREHQGLVAARKPDILGLLSSTAKAVRCGRAVQWTDIVLVFELKFRQALKKPLKIERDNRRAPDVPPSRGVESDEETNSGRAAVALSHCDGTNETRHTLEAVIEARAQPRAQKPLPSRHSLQEDDLLAGLDGIPSIFSGGAKDGKVTSVAAEHDVALQNASYALEILSCTYGTRSHCLCPILKDDLLSLWYYDACGIVYTKERLSLVANFEWFAAIIVGFAQCTPEQFGVLPSAVMRPPTPYPTDFPPQNLENNTMSITHPVTKEAVGITLGNSLFTQYGITGRRTFLYTIETDRKISDKKMIIKLSYQARTRLPEYSLVEIARKANVRHIPDIHMWADLRKMSDGIRHIFLQDNEDKNEDYEDRVVRAIVYTRYSSIRPLFAESCELIPVMVHQMIDCLDDLWTKVRMLHRDISLSNIMYEKRGDYYHFILIDFDMAVVVPVNEASYTESSRHRTGTLPFMAQELICDAWTALQRGTCWIPIKHLFRHDLESLFWNSLWASMMLPTKGLTSKEIEKLVKGVRKWETGSLYNIAGTKEQIILKGLESNNIVLPPAAARLNKWFKAWVKVLSRTYMIVAAKARRGSDSDSSDDEEPVLSADWETGGGATTKEHLQRVLLKAFPMPDEYLPASEEPVRVAKTKVRTVKAAVVKNAPRPQRPARKKPKVVTPTVMPENDIRSRLRPRKPRL
ncbi:hypothetical protein NM688_g7784 [Phlebia brevispora]|uniref:Uncharacterized protein n=1 Tax=Phlebia brevispora TaxID=194682 RepID=A0ACC1S1D3_9APHY|nr:hypothetical protein NM688_g7784 [Phlebia brevispora]